MCRQIDDKYRLDGTFAYLLEEKKAKKEVFFCSLLARAANISANMRLDLGKQSIDLAPRTRISSKQIIMNGSACVSNDRKVVSFHETKARRHLSTCFLFSFSIAFLFFLSLSLLFFFFCCCCFVFFVHCLVTRLDWCQMCLSDLQGWIRFVLFFRLDTIYGYSRRTASVLDEHR